MRRMQYNNPYLYESVRPLKVYQAAKYLIGTDVSEHENVALSDDWSRYQDGNLTMSHIGYCTISKLKQFDFEFSDDTLGFIFKDSNVADDEEKKDISTDLNP